MRFVTAAVVAGVLAMAGRAEAQSSDSMFFISVNGGYQAGSQSYTDAGTFRLYDETGHLNVSSETSPGPLLDVSAGVKVAGHLTVGAGFHRTSSTDPATITGDAPHPIFFDRPRSFNLTVDGLKRTEQALHLSLGYMVDLTDKVTLHVYAGPSQFRYSQHVPGSVAITETSGTFASVTATPTNEARKANTWGGHAAADLSYAIFQSGSSTIAIGGFVRYAQASSEFQVVSNTVSTKVGNIQMGGGLRIRF